MMTYNSCPASTVRLSPTPAHTELPLLLIVEGGHDINVLRKFSSILRQHDAALPDLGQLEADQRLLFLSVGGSNVGEWSPRLASLAIRQFHIYDKEAEPFTSARRQIVHAINQRPGCAAVLTAKRALENYLHPAAIHEACGVTLAYGDDDDVPRLLARAMLASQGGQPWDDLEYRARKRLVEKAKRRLNVGALECMTAERLAERDRHGEIVGWLVAIRGMADGAQTTYGQAP